MSQMNRRRQRHRRERAAAQRHKPEVLKALSAAELRELAEGFGITYQNKPQAIAALLEHTEVHDGEETT